MKTLSKPFLRIALLGYGKMGQAIEQEAQSRGHTIVLKTRRGDTLPLSTSLPIDVCIDFSHADSLMEHLDWAGKGGKNIVIGTTGWDSLKQDVDWRVELYGIGMLAAPNFSFGMHCFSEIARQFYSCMQERYQSGIAEMHHAQKADKPSGTALHLARLMNVPIESIASLRCGAIPGEHTILFDGQFDSITLSHCAKNRAGFASGAVDAAEWIVGKKGSFQLKEMWPL